MDKKEQDKQGEEIRCTKCSRLVYKIGVNEKRYYKYYCDYCHIVIERFEEE